MRLLGRITAQLSQIRFGKIGSLFEEEGCFTLKPCFSPGFLFRDRCYLQGILKKGNIIYKALLSAYFGRIQHLTLEHHAFFAPVPVPREYENHASYPEATDRWNDFVTLESKSKTVGTGWIISLPADSLRK